MQPLPAPSAASLCLEAASMCQHSCTQSRSHKKMRGASEEGRLTQKCYIIDDNQLKLTQIDVMCQCLLASCQGNRPITGQHMHEESLLLLTLGVFCLSSVLMSSKHDFSTKHTLLDLKTPNRTAKRRLPHTVK